MLPKPAARKLPHITWCLTGPLSFLPIHAVGLYGAKTNRRYLNTSFLNIPQLDCILIQDVTPCNAAPRLGFWKSPGPPRHAKYRFPGVIREVDAIQTIQGSAGHPPNTLLNDREATVAAVLQGTEGCDRIHLTCRCVQDSARATDSVVGRLTLKGFMKHSFPHAELAVLSACQTATGDKELPEEVVHLAAGMLLEYCCYDAVY